MQVDVTVNAINQAGAGSICKPNEQIMMENN